MRLSEESIKNVLDLLKKKLPLVYCSCGIERLSDLSRGIIYYNGKVKSKLDKDNDEFKNIYFQRSYPIKNKLYILMQKLSFPVYVLNVATKN